MRVNINLKTVLLNKKTEHKGHACHMPNHVGHATGDR
jgi:hypothetical protein